ncbi:MAG: exo-alpha-sialidase [Candidatus Promineifilaceae bacterium]|nr:exo-alpha-sialidase [Candidatus Promineifilaceae bacterium]
MSSKRGRGIRLSFVLVCLLVLFGALLWGRYAAAAQDGGQEGAQQVEEAELLHPMANWSEAVHVSTTASNGAFVPVIKMSSTGRLMILYNHETDDGVENPYYSQSSDGGDTWSTPAPVHSSETNARQVAFDFVGNTAHAIWRTSDSIWHAREGQWAANGSNLVVNAGEFVFEPDIAAGPDGVLHAVWTQQDQKLYYSVSRNDGATWSTPQELTTGQNRANVPDIAIDQNGDAHVVWEERIFDGSPWRYEIRYRKGNVTASAVNWDAYLVLATSPDPNQAGEPRQPAIAARGNDLHVGFSRRLESDEQYPYYIGYSAANGWDDPPTNTSPGYPIEVNTNTPFYLVSTVAGCSSGVHLYYHGAVDPNPREQILGTTYKGTWSPRTVVTEPDIRSINPSMVCTGATVHLAYSQIFTVNDNHQIFYIRRSPTVYLPTIHNQ